MSDERPSQGPSARVGFEVSSERGCVVLKLEDGAVLHVHPIVLDVMRAGTTEAGEPVYSVSGGLAVRLMTAPEEEGK